MLYSHEKLSNVDIVIYALYLLGGWHKRIHTEDIALKCYELASSKFSWIKYPKYPDLMTTLQALGDAKKEKYNSLVIGESERKSQLNRVGGWLLTKSGIRRINENIKHFEKVFNKKEPLGDRLDSNKRLKNLLNSIAFKKFLQDKNKPSISYAEFTESIVCTVNTRKEIINNKIYEFISLSEKIKNTNITEFIEYCSKKYITNIGGKDE